MEFSIVTTLFHSESYINEFYERMTAAVKKLTDDYEIIFVNDGSPDRSLEIAINIHNQDEKVAVIDLSRNFSHHKALMTGLKYAKGDRVFLIDSDLEERPELIGEFNDKLKTTRVDSVYGVQKKRNGHLMSKLTGHLFYIIFNYLSGYKISNNQMTVRLMSSRFVKNLLLFKDKEVFLPGLISMTGFDQIPLRVEKNHKGDSTYTFRRKVSLLVNSITSFSSKPLLFIFYSGVAIFTISMIFAINLIIKRIFFKVYMSGWPSLMVSIWLLGGITILSLGIIGIYLSKIFSESKDRPVTIVRAIYYHNIK